MNTSKAEQSGHDLSAVTWRKSSASAGEHECVEVADLPDGARAVRDSKVPEGPAFIVGPGAWSEFVGGVAGV
ncbi:DUF397 domain-containing protein [Streptomyces sp. NPDC058257]|uniref:DUF397 domain-containing protein n=1 Tax=Streptomyces sp. NPDC058257 TaxID=3346409 RepID=UPI0036E7CD12